MALDRLGQKIPEMSSNMLLRLLETLLKPQFDLTAAIERSGELNKEILALNSETMSQLDVIMLLRVIESLTGYNEPEIAAAGILEQALIKNRLLALECLEQKIPNSKVNILLLAFETLSRCSQLDLIVTIARLEGKKFNKRHLALDCPEFPDMHRKMVLRLVEALPTGNDQCERDMIAAVAISDLELCNAQELAIKRLGQKLPDLSVNMVLRCLETLSTSANLL